MNIDNKVALESMLQGKSIKEIKKIIRIHMVIMFFYKESTIFFAFLSIFMGSFIYCLYTYGPTPHTMRLGILEAIFYLPFYLFIVKNIHPFKTSKQGYVEIKEELEVMLYYKEKKMK